MILWGMIVVLFIGDIYAYFRLAFGAALMKKNVFRGDGAKKVKNNCIRISQFFHSLKMQIYQINQRHKNKSKTQV